VGGRTRNRLQDFLEGLLVVKDQFNLVFQQRTQYPLLLANPESLSGGVSDYHRDGLRLRQQPQNVFGNSDLIEAQPNHGVLLGQHGLFNPPHFDYREQHRRCRKQLCPVSLDEASRGRINSDDQIGRSLSVERLKIFKKFGLSSVVAISSRDAGLFLNVQRPTRLSVQFLEYLPGPKGHRLEIRAIRTKEQDLFRLSGPAVRAPKVERYIF
jgi:hypothetical protein